MEPLSTTSITVDEIDLQLLREKKVSLSVLRLDKIHPIISGNKWFKLKYYLEEAVASGKKHIATFGGAYSNHIVATAAAGKLFGLQTTGIIRGEKPAALSHTLKQAMAYGMEIIFVDREQYRGKQMPIGISDPDNFFLVNEGGYGAIGVKGAAEILNYCQKQNYSHFTCAVGTSTMMAGLVAASSPGQKIIGIPALRNAAALEKDLFNLLPAEEKMKKFTMIHAYHFGGYAKYTTELIDFMNEFYNKNHIPTDFVYTGKLFYGVIDLVQNNYFPKGSSLLLVHSGGLQGNLSLPKGTLIF
jgi:1-aminocyclopropane-1-carboxylate deaminase